MKEKIYTGEPSNLKEWFKATFGSFPIWLDQAIYIGECTKLTIDVMFEFKDFYGLIDKRTYNLKISKLIKICEVNIWTQ